MRKTVCLMIFIFGILVPNYSQTATPTPTPRPVPVSTPSTSTVNARPSGRISGPSLTDFSLANPRTILLKETYYLYRKPTIEELQSIAPNQKDQEKYAYFIKHNKAGLVRLVPDFGCNENNKLVVNAENCLRYSMPGNGSAFSFRTKNYRIWRLADLIFTKNNLLAGSIFSQGILVNLGDISLEEVDLNHEGAEFLLKFEPKKERQEARNQDLEIAKGINFGKYLYRRNLEMIENATYILRTVAYKGKFLRAEKGIVYDEFEFDKRKDVIVAFRIIRKDADGSITFIWKELQRKDSPKLKVEK